MAARLLAALLLFSALVSPAVAQWKTVDTFESKGAYGLIIIPENWKGGLFIYAHGYSADQRLIQPFPPDLTLLTGLTKLNVLFQATLLPTLSGYASATTTFRSPGWAVKDSLKDIENVRRYFVKKYGKPKHTYLWGHSGGGGITATLIEYMPKTYDGALPMCGWVAGARRNFDGAFDLRVMYEYACRDVPEARFTCRVCSDGASRCLQDTDCPSHQTCGAAETPSAPEDGLTRECTDFLLAHPEHFSESPTAVGGDFVSPPVTACFGNLSADGPSTPNQLARRDLFLRATQIPESFVLTDMFFASIGMAEIVHRRTNGHHPWGNATVDYNSPLLTADERAAINSGVHRATEDADAVRYLSRFYEFRGRTASKVLTVHALDDGLVIPENEDKYRQTFEASGRANQLVQTFTASGGHCGFISALSPALTALTGWVERNQKPGAEALKASCAACDFTTLTPGAWGLKVAERKQRTVPARAFVCDSATDCPTGTRCNTRRHRCQTPHATPPPSSGY